MNIRYMGHACFFIETESGARLLTDPYDRTVGYPMPRLAADVVTVSHDHHDHNYTAMAEGNPVVVDCEVPITVSGVTIEAYGCYHDDAQGGKRGKNLLMRIRADGLNVCHCGDLGHMPDQALIDSLGEIDVLMLPVGGVYTLDAAGVWAVAQRLKPRVVIPMHYRTDVVCYQELAPVEDFLALAGAMDATPMRALRVHAANINTIQPIVVLDWRNR